MKKTMSNLIAVITLFGVCVSVHALPMINLVSNGSFEDTTNFVENYSVTNSMQLFAGDTALTSWTILNQGGQDMAWLGASNPYGVFAPNGYFFVDLTGWHDVYPFSGLSQTIATIVGHTYSLSLSLGSYDIQNNASLQVDAGNTGSHVFSTYNFTNGPMWEEFSFTFVADDANTTLLFQGLSGVLEIGLDNIKVYDVTPDVLPTDVPEPGTVALLALGLFGFAAARRRMK